MILFLRRSACVFLVMPVLAAATLAWGADSASASFLHSCLLLAAGAITLVSAPGNDAGKCVALPLLIALGLALGALCALHIALVAGLHAEYFVLLASAAAFLGGRQAGLSQRTTRLAWTCCIVLGALYAIWAVWTSVMNPEQLHGQERAYDTSRLTASFLSANTAATMLGVIALLAMGQLARVRLDGLLRYTRGRAHDHGLIAPLALIAFLFALAGLFLTGSRAGSMLCLGCLVILAVWSATSPGRRNRLNGLAISVVLAIAVGVAFAPFFFDRLGSTQTAFDVRMAYFIAYKDVITLRPLTGFGLGGFEQSVREIMTAENAVFLHKQGAAHNVYLQWLVQAGIIGAFLMWTMIGVVLADIWRAALSSRSDRRIMRAILCVSLFVLAHGTVDYALEIPGMSWWWAWLLGLAHGVAGRKHADHSENAEAGR